MIHEARLFDFPGRNFTFQCDPDVDVSAASVAAARAFASVVEPTVVECITDDLEGNRSTHHLVSSPRGGAYLRDPARTTSVPVIDARVLFDWLEQVTEGGAVYCETLSISDGWYAVDAVVGDVIRLHETLGANDVPVLDRNGVAVVPGPTTGVLVPPLVLTLHGLDGSLFIALHWSPWIDRDGVGRGSFDNMCEQLANAGWKLVEQPAAADLRPYVPPAEPVPIAEPIVSPPVRDHVTKAPVSWVTLPATKVVLGLTDLERERLADMLVEIDRACDEDSGSFGFREYDAQTRRREIIAGLATALGHKEVHVAPCEIMRRPVTNAMWRTFMEATGAARPSAWTSTITPPDDEPVTGVSFVEAAAFAAHSGWSLPTEAEWQLAATGGSQCWFAPTDDTSVHHVERIANGPSEYTSDPFEAYPQGDSPLFVESRGMRCARGEAARVPACIPARRGLAPDHRFKFVRFRCVRRT